MANSNLNPNAEPFEAIPSFDINLTKHIYAGLHGSHRAQNVQNHTLKRFHNSIVKNGLYGRPILDTIKLLKLRQSYLQKNNLNQNARVEIGELYNHDISEQHHVNLAHVIAHVIQIEMYKNCKESLRKGFSALIKNDASWHKLISDINGNYSLHKDAILFMLDHLSPSMYILEIKKKIIQQVDISNVTISDDVRNIIKFVVSGVDDEHEGKFRELQKIYDKAYETATLLSSVLKL